MKIYADQVRNWVDAPYVVLGTDGFGRSATRENLRDFFEVDANHIAYHALYALAEQGEIDKKVLLKAAKTLAIDAERPNPVTV